MYDLRLLRDNLDGLRERLGPRGKDVAWEELRKLTEDRRTRTIEVEDLRHHLKTGSDEVARLKREKQPAEAAMSAMKALGDTIKGQEEQLRLIEEQLSHIALRIPNLPHESVPTGQDAAQNVEVRRWGSPPHSPLRPGLTGILERLLGFWTLIAPSAWRKPALPC